MLLSRGDSKVRRPSCQYSAVNETTWLPCFIISSLSSFSCVCCLLWSVQCVSSTFTGELTFYLVVLTIVMHNFDRHYTFRAVLAKFGPSVARLTLFFLITSCGMYISSTAFLPSSFAMYLGMMALGAWFEESYEVRVYT